MDQLKRCTRSSSRRLSPRLHNNANASLSLSRLVDGRRFSPRLHKNSPNIVIVSSPGTCSPKSPQCYPVESSLSPKFREIESLNHNGPHCEIITDSQTQSPNRDPNFRTRLSPRLRLHRDLATENPTDVSENSSISLGTSQMQRRLSPRLHKIVQVNKSQEPSLQRRVSPRLHTVTVGEIEIRKPKLESTPQPQRRVSPRLHSDAENYNQNPNSKRSRSGSHTNNSFSNAKTSKHGDNGCEKKLIPAHLNGRPAGANDEPPGLEVTMGSKVLEKKPKISTDAPVVAGRSIHARVKNTLRIFNTYYLQSIQEEEERRKKSGIDREKNSKASKSKDKDVKQTSSRPDLKAISKMKEKEEILYPDKRIGHIPGIEVGYQFFSRAEMVAIGFHSHWLNGIDYIGLSAGKKDKHGPYTFPIATAVVMSGQYEDDLDNSDDIIYTGQGGHDLVGSKLQCADQVLLRGNLAMKNSMEQSVPVRVVRGHRSANSYSGKIYTYDGLYKVVETWADKGQRGHLVYKYHLKRIEGQPKLSTIQVQFVRGCPSKAFSELPGLVCRDISNGQEAICIPVTNLYDDAHVDEGFTYIKTIEVAGSVNLPPSTAGCACKGNCTNPKTCACAKLNGSDFPYVRRDGGRLVEAKDVVFECGPNCSCGPGCLNRTSQRGIKYHLEVYRTPDKGWAVRSWDFIPSGAPVCEYIGFLRRSDEVDNISGNDYIFEIDCWHTMNEIEGRERRFGNVPVSATSVLPRIDDKTLDSAPEFCLDAGSRGNVARFINHSCEPNLFVQCILSAHHDLRLARVVLFAAENIPRMQELTYDYGYALDSVTGPDGKVKALPCFCGTADCRKRLY